jgi:hypothetical protein
MFLLVGDFVKPDDSGLRLRERRARRRRLSRDTAIWIQADQSRPGLGFPKGAT